MHQPPQREGRRYAYLQAWVECTLAKRQGSGVPHVLKALFGCWLRDHPTYQGPRFGRPPPGTTRSDGGSMLKRGDNVRFKAHNAPWAEPGIVLDGPSAGCYLIHFVGQPQAEWYHESFLVKARIVRKDYYVYSPEVETEGHTIASKQLTNHPEGNVHGRSLGPTPE